MATFKVVEIFESINGEGRKAGQLAVFVRLQRCNLSCSYCDTRWANGEDAAFTPMTEQEIYERIKQSGINNVTLTGGEPLLHPNVLTLLKTLTSDSSINVEIETNGSINLEPFSQLENRPAFTMDYKLPSSGMEDKMDLANFSYLAKNDVVKFVSGSVADLETALYIINKYDLTTKCSVYISPIFGSIEPCEIVDFMKDNKMNNINLQLQLHKFIWSPEERGV